MIRLAPAERLLLTAALADPPKAARAWELWRRSNTLDAAAWPSARLFTLVGHQLRAAGSPDPDLERLQGAQRHAWANGVATAREAADASHLLDGVGVPSMVLKGIALQHAYPSPGLRAMGDADLLIPEALLRTALTALGHGGWKLDRLAKPRWHSLLVADKGTVARRNGRDLDVHWRPVHDLPHGVDAALWRDAVQRTVHGRTLRRPHPSHQFVIVLAHGLRDGSGSVLQGLCDGAMLLRTGEVDPQQVLDLARRWQRLGAVNEAVGLLRKHANTEEIERFARGMRGRRFTKPRPSWRDSLAHVARTIEPGRLSGQLARAAQIGAQAAPHDRQPGTDTGAPATGAEVLATRHRLVRMTPGQQTELGRPGLAARLCREGWSGVEPWGRWTDGPKARLVFTIDARQQAATWPVMFFMHCHLGRRERQTVSVRVDGRRAAVWRWRGNTEARGEVVLLPTGRPVEVEFRIRHLAPLGPLDRRLLGLAVQWIRVETGPPPAPSE